MKFISTMKLIFFEKNFIVIFGFFIPAFLQSRKGILEGVCISGGEPTLQADLPEFIRKIRTMGFHVKLDTNGSRPGILKALLEEGA